MVALCPPSNFVKFGPCAPENRPEVLGPLRTAKFAKIINNSAADCSITLKFGTEFDT